MRKRISSVDVAKRANVSQATVSYVLSNRADKTISEETRARVLKAAEDLSYVPNRLADGILRGKTSTVGVLMPDFAHSFNTMLLTGLEGAFADAGFRTLIAHSRNNIEAESHQIRLLLEHRVDGIVVVTDETTISELPKWTPHIRRQGIPLCIVDDATLDGTLDTVVSDDVAGSRMAVQHLIDHGHRRIAYLGGGDTTTTSRDRRRGYEEVLRENGIAIEAELELGSSYRRESPPDLSPLLDPATRPTAVFAASDGLAGEAIIALRELGVTLPEMMAFVGYGNLEFARYLALTTVDQLPEEMGRDAARKLLRRMDAPDAKPETNRLLPNLVVRPSSTGFF